MTAFARQIDQILDYLYENSVRRDPGSVIDAIDGFSRERGGMIHLGRQKGEIFDRIVRRSGAMRVLELGTNFGYSALRLACNLETDAAIDTLECDPDIAEIAAAVFAYSGLADRIKVIPGRANRLLQRFSEPFDLIFIDHYPENYLADLRLIERLGLLRPGSIIITDNVVIFENQIESYLRHLRHMGPYNSTLHQPAPGSDGIEVSIRLDAAA